MRSGLSIVLVAVGGLVVLACGGGGSDGPPFGSGGTAGTGGGGLTCETLENPPAGCDTPCPGGDADCEAGTFCLNGVCSAQCTTDPDCGSGYACTPRGTCLLVTGTGGTGGTGNSGGNACRDIEVTPTRSIPNVMFLVDQSGSMTTSFGGGENRWEAANTVINSIVSGAESIVRFGVTTYASRNGDQNPPCPRLPTQIDFALENSVNIADTGLYPYEYPTDAGEDTPTGDSIDSLVSIIQSDPPPSDGPTIIVLATDGAPDSCEYPDPSTSSQRQQAEGEVVTAAGAAHDAGIDLFVLWVGTLSDNGIRNHLQEVANEGVGLPADGSGGDAQFWVGTDPQSLEDEFCTIIRESISCEIQIDRPFDDREKACLEGDVRLGGVPLTCSTNPAMPGDWQVKEDAPNVIELLGDACTTFKDACEDEPPTFTATFPCGAVVVD